MFFSSRQHKIHITSCKSFCWKPVILGSDSGSDSLQYTSIHLLSADVFQDICYISAFVRIAKSWDSEACCYTWSRICAKDLCWHTVVLCSLPPLMMYFSGVTFTVTLLVFISLSITCITTGCPEGVFIPRLVLPKDYFMESLEHKI